MATIRRPTVDHAPLLALSPDQRDVAYTLAASSTHPKSAAVRDALAGLASFRPELVQVRRPGGKGRLVWRTVTDVALTWEQLEMF